MGNSETMGHVSLFCFLPSQLHPLPSVDHICLLRFAILLKAFDGMLKHVCTKKRYWIGGTLFLMSSVFVLPLYSYNFFWQDYPALAWLQQKLDINQPHDSKKRPRPTIIGHRGAGLNRAGLNRADPKAGYIGNTRQAIEKGLSRKVDWIEIDVPKTYDDQLVVFHDPTLDRVTDVNEALPRIEKKPDSNHLEEWTMSQLEIPNW